MCKKGLLLILGIFSFGVNLPLAANQTNSQRLELKHENGDFSLPKIKDWIVEKDMFGMPFMLFSPKTNGQRSNISFSPMGKKIKFEKEKLKKKQEQYVEGRQRWAAKVGAEIVTTAPYTFYKNKSGNEIHSIGFEYKLKGKHYVERSYYISCRYLFFYSKALRLSSNGLHDNVFEKLIDGFDCK